MSIVQNFDITKDPFRGSLARKAGLVSARELRGYRRLFQDVYVNPAVPVTHELRCRGASLIVPAEAVLTGRSAATVDGIRLAATYDPVEFIVSEKHRFGPIKGIEVRRTRVHKRESRAWQGARIAKPLRVALDLLLRHSARERGWVRRLRVAVPDLDIYLRARKVRLRDVMRAAERRRNRGIIFARHAISMANNMAESPKESEVRVILEHAGIKTKLQHKVRRGKRCLGRLDMCVEAAKVAIEYDGRWHDRPGQQDQDRERRARLQAEGWRFVILNYDDLCRPWEHTVDRVRAALAERLPVEAKGSA